MLDRGYFLRRLRQTAYPAPPTAAVASMTKVPGSGVEGAGVMPAKQAEAPNATKARAARIDDFMVPSEFGVFDYFFCRFRQIA
jgi:hypothetical protein